jgi:hypothetical protein
MILRGLWRAVVDLVLYQGGWLLCVLGTASGRQWAGPAYAVFALLVHLAIVPHPGRTALAIALVGAFGFAADGLWTALGLLTFPDQELLLGWLPPWMLALWVMFAFLLDSALGWLRGRAALAAALGLVLGPAAYLGGASLGALEMHGVGATLAVGVTWAVAMPLAAAVFDAVDPGRRRIGPSA